jgi:anti-sigma factor RsiW
MKCSEIRKIISQYMDDDLSPGGKEAFIFHVRDCSACSEELREIESVHALFASAEKYSASYGFCTKVMANLEAKESSWLWDLFMFHRSLLRAVEVALALIVVMLGIISGNVMVKDRTSEQQTVQITVQETFSLDLFRAAPAGSIGGAYAGLMEANNER